MKHNLGLLLFKCWTHGAFRQNLLFSQRAAQLSQQIDNLDVVLYYDILLYSKQTDISCKWKDITIAYNIC